MKTMTEAKTAFAALCAAVTMSASAGVRVEIDEDCRGDRAVQIAADEFRSFYSRLTGREAAHGMEALLATYALPVEAVKEAPGDFVTF